MQPPEGPGAPVEAAVLVEPPGARVGAGRAEPPWWVRRRPLALHQFHLACQTHGGGESLRVMKADGVAERWKEAAGVELDALILVVPACAR